MKTALKHRKRLGKSVGPTYYLLFLLSASAFKRATRLAARLASPLRNGGLVLRAQHGFVCAGGCFTSDFMTILLIVPPNAALATD